MRRTGALICLVALLFCLSKGFAQPPESPLAWFARMDRNQDGKLSYAEVPSPRFAAFEYPGIILRFSPETTDSATVVGVEQELDIKELFNQAWNTPTAMRRGAIAAYNRFLPVTGPESGEPLWLCGAWVERPGAPNPPHNGSVYLIRHRDGRYDWGYVYDTAHPVPAGQRLTGTRDIEPSPFEEERGRVYYFCGYDGGAGPSHNTAWIYHGELPTEESEGEAR